MAMYLFTAMQRKTTRLYAQEAVDGIDLSKTLREADGLGIKPEDNQYLGHAGGGR